MTYTTRIEKPNSYLEPDDPVPLTEDEFQERKNQTDRIYDDLDTALDEAATCFKRLLDPKESTIDEDTYSNFSDRAKLLEQVMKDLPKVLDIEHMHYVDALRE